MQIDPVSGTQTTLANNINGAYDIAIDAAGDLFVVEQSQGGQITQVDPVSGAQTLIAPGSSLTNSCAYSIDADAEGNLITSDYCSGIVAATDGTTGAQANLATLPQYGPLGVAVDAGGGLQSIEWATLQIINLLDGASEVLAADTTGTNISASYNSGTGTLSLTGKDTPENYQAVLRTATYSNTNPSGGSRIIEVTVNDGTDSNSPTAKSTIILNSPPVADAGGPYNGSEGSGIAMSNATASDPDVGDTLTYAWTVDSALCSFDDANALNPTLTCSDNGSFTATLEVSDGSETASSVASVTVDNAAPTLGAISVDVTLVPINTVFTASADFTDPGTLDTHSAVWDWGNASTSAGTVTQDAGSGSVSDSHSYSEAGVYTVMLTVTDNNLADSNASVFKYVVAYDPSAGFVTGGGWIISPAGALVGKPDAFGKAEFGFVAKYKKGANVPSGNTEFQFEASKFHFHSTSYEWLVVAGAKAQFKGEGTVEGSDHRYGFMLTAIEGSINGGGGVDKFRLKIWDLDGGGVVYDNQIGGADDADPSTAISKGSIVIHK